ncbi:hypothetical protein Tco_0766237 [Tanacetum coccineum]
MTTSKLPSLIGMRSISKVSGQMTHLVRSLTLDSARSCVMQSAFLSQGKASNIPTVFSWGGSISSESFMPSILLLAVIIVVVAIVVTVILVVVDAIIGVVVVVSYVPSIIKHSFVIIGDLIGLFYSDRLGVCIPPGQGVIGHPHTTKGARTNYPTTQHLTYSDIRAFTRVAPRLASAQRVYSMRTSKQLHLNTRCIDKVTLTSQLFQPSIKAISICLHHASPRGILNVTDNSHLRRHTYST